MKSPTIPSELPSAGKVDVLVAKLGVVGAVLLLGLQLFASQPFLLVIPLSIGTGSWLYLATDREAASRTAVPTLPGVVAGYLPSVVLLGLAAVVVAIRLVGSRTVPIYLLTGAVGAVVFVQILFVDGDDLAPGVILAEIAVAAVVIRLSALFATPGFVGVDIWTHALVFTEGIASQGDLGALAGTKYVMAPLYHAVGAVGTQAFGSVREGIYLTVGVIVPLSALLVYATGTLLVPTRWALLATALYAFADQFIRWGMHLIPTSLGLAFFIATVYLVVRTFRTDAELRTVVLALAAALAVVATHQVSTAITLVFLGVAALVAVAAWLAGSGDRAARKAAAATSVFVATLAVTVVSWANTPFSGSETFLGREIAVVAAAFVEDAGFLNLAGEGGGAAGGGAGAGGAYAWLVPYVELFGFALLLAAAVVGGLLLLRRTVAPDVAFTLVFAAGTMFVAVFGLSLFGVRALLPGRWMAFLYVPMALLAAAGVYHLARSGSPTLAVVAFLVLALGYPSTMVVAEKATLDSPAFDDRHARFAYSEAEIAAVRAIAELRPPGDGGTVATDHPYDGLFEDVAGYERATLALGPDGPVGTNATVARDYQSRGPVIFDRTEGWTPDAGDPAAAVCPDDWNVVYANDDVRLCTATEGGDGT